MNAHRNETHSKQVAIWESESAKGVSASNRVKLFVDAIKAIERRSLATLSNVTMMVVEDRAVHESKTKFPVLSELKIGYDGIDFTELLKSNNGNQSELICNALRFLLIELLNVVGNITADILTAPLHQELMTVVFHRQLTLAEAKAKTGDSK
jgi:hypothetical protein